MKHSFIDVTRQPDSVLFQYEDSPIRFEEPFNKEEQLDKIGFDNGKITLYPSSRPVKRVKLRWRGDMSDVMLVYGDDIARYLVDDPWKALTPHASLWWYFHAFDGEVLNSFGVKTGCACFAMWQCDPFGITLWLDVRNGGGGVVINEPFVAAETVCAKGSGNDFADAKKFCAMMCDKPSLPEKPIFGVNNWYWAYGDISHDSVMTECDYLMEMCRDVEGKPHMIIDDGWQYNHYFSTNGTYNGGPWDKPNSRFASMADTADGIHNKGALAGIWFRPLLTCIEAPTEAQSPNKPNGAGFFLDATHPYTLEKVAEDTSRIRGWGYDLIKHDFTTFDNFGYPPHTDGDWHFFDRTKTNAQMLLNLYKTIQCAADGANVIGCNTVNHLAAGIHQCQRSGGDTSGRSFEITRKNGVKCMVRLPQHNTFFAVDPDCAAFTESVSHELNLDFLEMAAVTGVVTLASVIPNTLTPDEMTRIRSIFRTASLGGEGAVPEKYVGQSILSFFKAPDGKQYTYDWYRGYDGVRTHYTWLQ